MAPPWRDEHTAPAKDKGERQPSRKEDCTGNRWNFGLIDARYDGGIQDDFGFFS